jgi:hypothetical protein
MAGDAAFAYKHPTMAGMKDAVGMGGVANSAGILASEVPGAVKGGLDQATEFLRNGALGAEVGFNYPTATKLRQFSDKITPDAIDGNKIFFPGVDQGANLGLGARGLLDGASDLYNKAKDALPSGSNPIKYQLQKLGIMDKDMGYFINQAGELTEEGKARLKQMFGG